MAFVLRLMEKKIWVGQFSSFSSDRIIHGISTRFGGVSDSPYDSLNLALHVGDDSAAVIENRQRFCQVLGLSAERITTSEQVHGERVFCVTEKEAGRGWRDYGDAISQTDALLTNVPGVPLFLCYADCVPVLFWDPKRRAVAIAHAGWKGTLQGIAVKTLRAMTAAFGTTPKDCLAAIGPAIGPEYYSVGDEVAEQFRTAFSGWEREIVRLTSGCHHLDLWAANRLQLEAAGIPVKNIDTAAVCTASNAKLFFSYRADGGKTGRMGAVIALKEQIGT